MTARRKQAAHRPAAARKAAPAPKKTKPRARKIGAVKPAAVLVPPAAPYTLNEDRPGTLATLVERGRYGRMILARVRPNIDLVAGVERVCASHGITYAVVRSAVGSLVDAALGYGEGDSLTLITVEGPGIEILTLNGEVRPDETGKPVATLRGTISDSDASVYGGEFVRGGNPICITLEIALQEWLPDLQSSPVAS
ncbi:MAG: DNA-binding protein [Alphaproteobacteria bacterium]|nr:DNA-binding protein [Alphaproteobacteria bacterium]